MAYGLQYAPKRAMATEWLLLVLDCHVDAHSAREASKFGCRTLSRRVTLHGCETARICSAAAGAGEHQINPRVFGRDLGGGSIITPMVARLML